MDNDIKPRLLTFKVASAYSGIPVATLKAYCYKSILPSVKIGKRRYLDRQQLDDWINSHRTNSNILFLRRSE